MTTLAILEPFRWRRTIDGASSTSSRKNNSLSGMKGEQALPALATKVVIPMEKITIRSTLSPE